MKLFRVLRNSDPAEGENSDPVPAQPPAPAPANPPAANTVNTGEISEETLKLKETVRQREMRIAQLEDENRTLKQIPAPAPTPKPVDKRTALEKFMEGED